jgi:hypothetical protein
MFLRDLPLEIQHAILEHCSPSDLAVLSRVHTSVRDVAEHALYSHIRYRARPLDMVSSETRNNHVVLGLKENRSLLHTFATNSRKASMVKAFYVELETSKGSNGLHALDDGRNVVGFVQVKLAEVLEKMPNLVDLRILYCPVITWSQGRISQAIRFVRVIVGSDSDLSQLSIWHHRGGYFKLHTLYLERSYDLEGIIAGQPQLRLLGIFSTFDVDTMDRNHRRRIERLYQSPSRRRMVFVLYCWSTWTPLHILPSFHRLGEALPVCQETAASPEGLPDEYDLSLCLLGTSEENINLFSEAVGRMTAFPRDYAPSWRYLCLKIVVLDKYIQVSYQRSQYIFGIHHPGQKPWRLPELVESLGLFEDVQALYFHFPDVEEEALRLLSTDLQSCLLKDLECVWSAIRTIRLRGQPGDKLMMNRKSHWTIVSEDDETQTESEDGYGS